MSRPNRIPRFLLAAALVGVGCTGMVGDGASPPTNPGGGGSGPPGGGGNNPPGGSGGGGVLPPPPPPNPADTTNLAGTAPLRRLNILEYNNSIRDLLGEANPAAAGAGLAVDIATDVGFVAGAKITSSTDARAFTDVSEKLATSAVSRIATLLPTGCNAGSTNLTDNETCATNFIKTFGLRAYRRPLSADEVTDLVNLYKAQRTASLTFTEAIKGLIWGMIQSPYFLYRWELGEPGIKDGPLVRFNSYEVASRLSYFFWASMPDQGLFDAAAKNALQNPDQIATEARRLLASPKAKDGVRDFTIQWLDIDGVPDLEKDGSFTNYTPEVGKAMVNESATFASELILGAQATGKLDTLYTSTSSYIDAKLAKLYGVTGVTGDTLKQTTLNPAQRAGILTQGAWLSAHADGDFPHIVKRGVFVLNHVLCRDIPPPVGLEVPPLPERKSTETNREHFAIHGMNPCAACHVMIDPMGFAFEIYDAVGGYRTTELNKPIDASGQIQLTSGLIKFKDAVDLTKQMSTTPEIRQCMTKHWLRYMLRRTEVSEEAGSLQLVNDAFAKGNFDIRELMVAVTKTRAFTHRKPFEGEALK
jgi:Protein of unknown function (DUF1592)/Protein of unknown function (DUF1588)/Protein of unknown function (DUF1595)/Protein of unknown function (DUF1585)/Protein of unknown function (DUF1587)